MTDNTATLTGPDNCAQCGQEIDVEAVLAETLAGPVTAVDHAYVTVKGHKIPVPGLYWDKACADQIRAGELESTLTFQAAQEFLDETWGPMVTGSMIMALARGDDGLAEVAASRIADIIETSHLLEALTGLQASPCGLDSSPQCDGHHEHKVAIHPCDVADMN